MIPEEIMEKYKKKGFDVDKAEKYYSIFKENVDSASAWRDNFIKENDINKIKEYKNILDSHKKFSNSTAREKARFAANVCAACDDLQWDLQRKVDACLLLPPGLLSYSRSSKEWLLKFGTEANWEKELREMRDIAENWRLPYRYIDGDAGILALGEDYNIQTGKELRLMAEKVYELYNNELGRRWSCGDKAEWDLIWETFKDAPAGEARRLSEKYMRHKKGFCTLRQLQTMHDLVVYHGWDRELAVWAALHFSEVTGAEIGAMARAGCQRKSRAGKEFLQRLKAVQRLDSESARKEWLRVWSRGDGDARAPRTELWCDKVGLSTLAVHDFQRLSGSAAGLRNVFVSRLLWSPKENAGDKETGNGAKKCAAELFKLWAVNPDELCRDARYGVCADDKMYIARAQHLYKVLNRGKQHGKYFLKTWWTAGKNAKNVERAYAARKTVYSDLLLALEEAYQYGNNY